MTTMIERLRGDIRATKDGCFPTAVVLLRDLEMLMTEYDAFAATIAECVVCLNDAGYTGSLVVMIKDIIAQLSAAKESHCDI